MPSRERRLREQAKKQHPVNRIKIPIHVAVEVADHRPATASRLLQAAAKHQEDRASQYDQPSGERSMDRTVRAFNIITGREGTDRALTESEGWLFMQTLKDVRDRTNGPHRDSLEDGISYSSLKAEARLRESPT